MGPTLQSHKQHDCEIDDLKKSTMITSCIISRFILAKKALAMNEWLQAVIIILIFIKS